MEQGILAIQQQLLSDSLFQPGVSAAARKLRDALVVLYKAESEVRCANLSLFSLILDVDSLDVLPGVTLKSGPSTPSDFVELVPGILVSTVFFSSFKERLGMKAAQQFMCSPDGKNLREAQNHLERLRSALLLAGTHDSMGEAYLQFSTSMDEIEQRFSERAEIEENTNNKGGA